MIRCPEVTEQGHREKDPEPGEAWEEAVAEAAAEAAEEVAGQAKAGTAYAPTVVRDCLIRRENPVSS